MARHKPSSGRSLDALHAQFLTLLPRIELHGRVYFRHVRSPEAKEEAVAELFALTWSWSIRLTLKGKDPLAFGSALAAFAARAVRSGRRLCGQERAKDVLSPRAQARGGFAVAALPEVTSLSGSPLEEALHENTVSPVPEQVSFRIDFPCWRASRTDRDRRVIDDLLLGELLAHARGEIPVEVQADVRALADQLGQVAVPHTRSR